MRGGAGIRRPWSYFQLKKGAGVRPWASHLRSPAAWSRALRETTGVLSAVGADQGSVWSQAGCTFLPSASTEPAAASARGQSAEQGQGTNSPPHASQPTGCFSGTQRAADGRFYETECYKCPLAM